MGGRTLAGGGGGGTGASRWVEEGGVCERDRGTDRVGAWRGGAEGEARGHDGALRATRGGARLLVASEATARDQGRGEGDPEFIFSRCRFSFY